MTNPPSSNKYKVFFDSNTYDDDTTCLVYPQAGGLVEFHDTVYDLTDPFELVQLYKEAKALTGKGPNNLF